MTETDDDPTRKITTVEKKIPPVRTRYDWLRISEQMRAAPMEWHCIYENDRTAVANAVRQGSVADVHPDLGFEALTINNRRTSPRTCDFYMRYNPEKETTLRNIINANRKK